MRIQVKLLSRNRPYTKLSPKGVVLHETATPGASAENEYKYFNNNDIGASAHGFVDWNGYIQTIPYSEVAWHAGYTANIKYIGIEMCHATNKADFDKVWNNTVELFVTLLKQYGWTVNDIHTHDEMSKLYKETDHTDPIGYFKKFGRTIDDFKKAVENKMNGGLTVTQYDELKKIINEQQKKIDELEKKSNPMIYNYIDNNMPAWARPTIQKLVNEGVLSGSGQGLNLTDDLLRAIVIMDRMREK